MNTNPLGKNGLRRSVFGATGVLAAAALLAAGHAPAVAKTHAAPATGGTSAGKALVSTYRCNGCHAANLAGKPGFSPSLHRSGVLKHYSLTTFVRVLMTGKTADGGHVRPPMPVYGAGMMMGMHGGPPPGMHGRPMMHGGQIVNPGGPMIPAGGPPPGGPPPGGPPPGGPPPGGMHGPGGMHHGPPPPPMKPAQASAIYMYLKTLP